MFTNSGWEKGREDRTIGGMSPIPRMTGGITTVVRKHTSTPIGSPIHRGVDLTCNTSIIKPNTRRPERYSLSDTSFNSELNSSASIPNAAGPLIASSRYNIGMGMYADTQSPGLTSRIVQYNGDYNGYDRSRDRITHLPEYNRPGLFPNVNLNKSPLKTIKPSSQKSVTVRIAPPENTNLTEVERNSILSNSFKSVPSNSSQTSHQSEISTRSVLDALKEISRKRIHARDEIIDQNKRHKKNFLPLSMPRREVVGKRGRDANDNSNEQLNGTPPTIHTPKKHRGYDAIISSLSSTAHLTEQNANKRKSTKESPDQEEIIKQMKFKSPNHIKVSEIYYDQKTQQLVSEKNVRTIPTQTIETSKPVPVETSKLVVKHTQTSDKEPPVKEGAIVKDNKDVCRLKFISNPPEKENDVFVPFKPTSDEAKKRRLAALLSAISGADWDVKSLTNKFFPSENSDDITDAPKGILSPPKSDEKKHVSFEIPVSTKSNEVTNFIVPKLDVTTTSNAITQPISSTFSLPSNTEVPSTPKPELIIKNSAETPIKFGSPISEKKIEEQSKSFTTPFGTAAFSSKPSESSSFGTSKLDSTNSIQFGTPATAASSSTPSLFQFNTKSTSAPAVVTPTPSFGTTIAATTASSSPVPSKSGDAGNSTLFGNSTTNSFKANTTTAAPTFAFGTSTSGLGTTTTTASTKPTFALPASKPTFGSSSSVPSFNVTTSSPGFGTATPSFGAATTKPAFMTPAPAPSSNAGNSTFGGTNPPPAFGSTTTPSSFGGTNPSPAFGSTTTQAFGSTTNSPSGGSFGATTTAPAFGATTAAPAFGATTAAPAFGATTATPAFGASTTTPSFGTTSTKPAFGETTATPAFGATMATPAFGATTTTPAFGATTTTPPFGATTTTPAFGASTGTPSFGAITTASGFGATTSTPAFGATTTPAFGASTATPAFGTPTAKPAFGTPTATPAFGTPTTTPAFGGTNPPAFGAQSPTFSAFGTPASTPSTFGVPASGFGAATTTTASNFGTSTPAIFGASNQTVFGSPTSAFGVPTTSPPAFGSPSQASPAFAGKTFQTPTSNLFGSGSTGFGATATSQFGKTGNATGFGSQAVSNAFGANTGSSTFGAGGNTFGSPSATTTTNGFGSATPTFGAPTTTASNVFGTSSTTPAFPSTGGFSGFNAGSSTTNAPAPSTGVFSFGGSSAESTPQQSGSSAFQFGAPTKPTAGGGFNFNVGSTAPSFTATPQFGGSTGNMFSIGTSSTAPRPRATTRYRKK